jgi:hypothetical protein
VAQEPEGSSPHSQQPATGPYPETVEYIMQDISVYATLPCNKFRRKIFMRSKPQFELAHYKMYKSYLLFYNTHKPFLHLLYHLNE